MSSVEQYGRFIPEENCFELVNEPPRKWINVHYNKIGEHEMYSEITNIGDGTTRIRDGRGRTCTLVFWDKKYTYIRDDESGTVFNPWGAPVHTPVTDRRTRYWAAKTETTGTCEGLRTTLRFFVPQDYNVEIKTVFLENLTDKPRTVSMFDYAAFELDGCDEQGRYIGKLNFAEVHPEIAGVLVQNFNRLLPAGHRHNGFLITINKEFVGGTGYRDNFTRSDFGLASPKILFGWNADNAPGVGGDCAGLVQVRFTIPPKGKVRADFLLGQTTGLDDAKALRPQFTPQSIDAMCQQQMDAELARAAAFTVHTENPNYDGLVNIFSKKQMYAYLVYKSGFRDNLQVDNAFCMVDYKLAEENLLKALASQWPDGKTPHGFRPVNRALYSDKPAWIMLTVPGLVDESGDLGLLDKVVPYFESSETGTVWDHMLRAMRYLCKDTGAHGLSDQHHADWNDGLEATKESGARESIMVTQQLCYGLLEVERLAKLRGDTTVAAEARQQWDRFARQLNDVAWDGEWYVRTICGDGYQIGSKTNEEGKIFINSQSWAILSQTAPADRAKMCMDSLEKHLGSDVGYKLCAPAFTHYDPRIGGMSNSIPGMAENGGCYCHGAAFKALADCMMGRAENAWDTFVKVMPDNPADPVSNSRLEPFSFTNCFFTHPLAWGRAGYPWNTGTAAWFVLILVEWILGARRSFEGLKIDPCLTKRIKHAGVVRRFRGSNYDISLDNTAGRCTGVTSIKLDGKLFVGTVLPVFKDGKTHKVEVVI